MEFKRNQQSIPTKVTLIIALVFVFMSNITISSFKSIAISQAELSLPASFILSTSHFFRSDLYSFVLTVAAMIIFVKRKEIRARFHDYSPSRKRIVLYGTIGFLLACILAVLFSVFYILPNVLCYVLTSSSYHTWINHYSQFSGSLYVKFLSFIAWYVPWFLPLLGITTACIVETIENDFLMANV